MNAECRSLINPLTLFVCALTGTHGAQLRFGWTTSVSSTTPLALQHGGSPTESKNTHTHTHWCHISSLSAQTGLVFCLLMAVSPVGKTTESLTSSCAKWFKRPFNRHIPGLFPAGHRVKSHFLFILLLITRHPLTSN